MMIVADANDNYSGNGKDQQNEDNDNDGVDEFVDMTYR